MSRIFLDIGAHQGQTISLVLRRQFRIDRVVGFDPSPICQRILAEKFQTEEKVTIINKGLWSKTCEMELHNEGSQGGSVHSDYQTTCDPEPRVTSCQFIKASDWFRDNVSNDDEVFLKLNCEGSECEILIDLIESGEYAKVKATLVDFDVRKSPKARPQEDELRKRMAKDDIHNIHVYMGNGRHAVLFSVLGR